MARPRKRRVQVREETRKVQDLINGGLTVKAACAEVGLNETAYRRTAQQLGIYKGATYKNATRKRKTKRNGERGSVRADSLPPRPRRGNSHGGKRPPKPLDLHDVASVTKRIAKIDKQLARVQGLEDERNKLGRHLVKLLDL